MHSGIQRKLETGKIRNVRIPLNLRAPLLTIPYLRSVVIGAIAIIEPGRRHHASIVEFSNSGVPTSMGRWHYINERLRDWIEDRSVGKTSEGGVTLSTYYRKGSITLGSTVD